MGNYLNRFCGGSQSHEEMMVQHAITKNKARPRNLPSSRYDENNFRRAEKAYTCEGWIYLKTDGLDKKIVGDTLAGLDQVEEVECEDSRAIIRVGDDL